MPETWFVGVGISLSFLAGEQPRAPAALQRLGLEWMHRLFHEPRRLFRRYVVQGLPFGLRLFAWALMQRLRRTRADGLRCVGAQEARRLRRSFHRGMRDSPDGSGGPLRILVTGHNGYIGSVLVPVLERAGHDVVGLDSDLFAACTFGPNGHRSSRCKPTSATSRARTSPASTR